MKIAVINTGSLKILLEMTSGFRNNDLMLLYSPPNNISTIVIETENKLEYAMVEETIEVLKKGFPKVFANIMEIVSIIESSVRILKAFEKRIRETK